MELWGFESRQELIGDGFGLMQQTGAPQRQNATIILNTGETAEVTLNNVSLPVAQRDDSSNTIVENAALTPEQVAGAIDALRTNNREPVVGQNLLVTLHQQDDDGAPSHGRPRSNPHVAREFKATIPITQEFLNAHPRPSVSTASHSSETATPPPPPSPATTPPPSPAASDMTHEDAQNVTRALNESTQQASGMATAQAVAAIGGTVVGLANASVNAVAANRLGTASYGAGYGPVLGGGYSGAYGGGFGGIDLTGTNFSLGLFGGDEQGKMRRMNALLNELMAKIRSGNFNMDDLLPALTLVTLQSKMTLSKAAFYMIQTMRSKQEEMSRNTERLAHINNPQASTEFAQINVQNQQIMMDQQVVQQSVQSVMGMVEEFSNLLNVIRTKVDRIRQAEMPRA